MVAIAEPLRPAESCVLGLTIAATFVISLVNVLYALRKQRRTRDRAVATIARAIVAVEKPRPR